jgi:LmbE family N-acetylglucosaminyl deacetylase
MKWIFLSPHLDDVVFSCGGYVWDLTSSGQQVEIWTICAADPPPGNLSSLAAGLHRDWGLADNAYQFRRQEDQSACQILGAAPRYLTYLDCIYRQSPEGEFFYDSEGAISGGLDQREEGLIDRLTAELESNLPGDARVVAPLGIGNHVDHQLTRKAANRLSRSPAYYAEYPYARDREGREILAFMTSSADWFPEIFPISGMGRRKWFEASRAYTSQLSIFWEDLTALRNELEEFENYLGGMKLWNTCQVG